MWLESEELHGRSRAQQDLKRDWAFVWKWEDTDLQKVMITYLEGDVTWLTQFKTVYGPWQLAKIVSGQGRKS